MLVGDEGGIYIQRDHPAYPLLVDFLVACCEPVSRTRHVEHYVMNQSSLSAAFAEGVYTAEIITHILQYWRLDEQRQLSLNVSTVKSMMSDVEAVMAEEVEHQAGASSGSGSEVERFQSFRERWRAASQREHEQQQQQERKTNGDQDAPSSSLPQRNMSVGDSERAVKSSARLQLSRILAPPPQKAVISYAKAPHRAGAPAASLPEVPAVVAAMLREEAAASKVEVVLQPPMTTFRAAPPSSSGPTHPTLATPAAADAQPKEAEMLLIPFLISTDKQLLESVVERLKEHLEPVMLGGSLRYILSDLVPAPATASSTSFRERCLNWLYTVKGGVDQPQQHRSGAGGGGPLLEYKVRVRRGAVRKVREGLFQHFSIRADCRYDYGGDRHSGSVAGLALSRIARLRGYQQISLDYFSRGGRAHQGVIVLPCGAGKTLTGIAAAARLGKRCLVMCVNQMSVIQWRREFLKWTQLTPQQVTVCTSREKDNPGDVCITTYSMLVAQRPTVEGRERGQEALRSEAVLHAIRSRTWGLLLLDEVHTALAHHFQEVLDSVQYHCVLGLSATLLREDDRISDLRYLVGPKLYEANWLDLTRAGYLAEVSCVEIQCALPLPYWQQYTEACGQPIFSTESSTAAGSPTLPSGSPLGSPRRRRRRRRRFTLDDDDSSSEDEDGWESDEAPTAGRGPRGRGGQRRGGGGSSSRGHTWSSGNPNKLWAAQALLHFHLNVRSPPDKVIVFCDYLFDAHYYAKHLHIPLMEQATSEVERQHLLQWFQYSSTVNAMILTRVGDVALDIPNANVVIQVSGLGASRRQEAQRLGRILRPKPPSLFGITSFFYSLVSTDTHEIRASSARQTWLRDQGFAYRVLTSDAVLRWLREQGGVGLRCVGPPQWWYAVTRKEFEVAKAKGSRRVAEGQQQHQPPGVREYHSAFWMPFSADDSVRLQYSFDRGIAEVVVRDVRRLSDGSEEAGDANDIHRSLEWCVHLSSDDAPHSFGLLKASSTSARGAAAAAVAAGAGGRRVVFGPLDPSHCCLSHPACIAFSIEAMKNASKS